MAGSNYTIDYSLAAALNAGGLKWLSVNLSADVVRDGFIDPVMGIINYTERLVGDVIDPVFSGTVYDLSDNFTIRVTVDGGDPFAPAYANIVTGDGADTIVLVIDPGPATAFADIDSGGGDDTITVSNNWYGTIIGGSGQDTLTFSGTCGISLAESRYWSFPESPMPGRSSPHSMPARPRFQPSHRSDSARPRRTSGMWSTSISTPPVFTISRA